MNDLTPDDAQHPRHRPQRDRILTLIALFKFVKGVTLVALGVTALRLIGSDLKEQARAMFEALGNSIDVVPVLRLLRDIGALPPTRLKLAGAGAFLYAALFFTEGIGLWRQKRWAEYLTVVATSSFIPFEIYEIIQKRTIPRISALVINVLVVLYLLSKLRVPPETTAAPEAGAASQSG